MPATPPYTPTDIGAAIGVLISFALDVLVGFFPQLEIDPTTRVALMASLTLLTGAAISAYIANRRVKNQAVAAVAVAQAAAAPAPTPPAAPSPFAGGGAFVITPIVPGASETHPIP